MIIREHLPESSIIIGCTRDSQIHTGSMAFQLFAAGLYDKMISVAEAKFMVACDAGPSWKVLLEQPPIFGIDEAGIPCFIKGGLAVPKPVGEAVAHPTPVESCAVMDHCIEAPVAETIQ